MRWSLKDRGKTAPVCYTDGREDRFPHLKEFCRTVLLILFVLAVFCWANPERAGCQETENPLWTTQRFLLVVVDGLEVEAVNGDTTPSIEGIGTAGVKIYDVAGFPPDSPDAVVASLLTGVTPARHGCYGPGDRVRGRTLFSLLAERETKTAVFVSGGMPSYGPGQGAGRVVTASGDTALVSKAIDYLREEAPYFTVVVLRGPRLARERGADHDEYLRAVNAADTEIGRLTGYLRDHRDLDATLLCVTGTTGRPPLFLKAAELRSGVSLPPAGIVDVAPTLGYLMGVELPAPEGLILWNALNGGAEQSGEYLSELRVRDLSRALFAARAEMRRLLGEQSGVQREKREVSNQRQAMESVVEARDRRIRQLQGAIARWKGAMLLALGLCGAGYYFEYRFLRRRYLLFK
ncbi:MAG: hypothetical protein AB1500_01175 [Bacillota bacterium]